MATKVKKNLNLEPSIVSIKEEPESITGRETAIKSVPNNPDEETHLEGINNTTDNISSQMYPPSSTQIQIEGNFFYFFSIKNYCSSFHLYSDEK